MGHGLLRDLSERWVLSSEYLGIYYHVSVQPVLLSLETFIAGSISLVVLLTFLCSITSAMAILERYPLRLAYALLV